MSIMSFIELILPVWLPTKNKVREMTPRKQILGLYWPFLELGNFLQFFLEKSWCQFFLKIVIFMGDFSFPV